jgi:hypothetical protein
MFGIREGDHEVPIILKPRQSAARVEELRPRTFVPFPLYRKVDVGERTITSFPNNSRRDY